MIDIKHLNLERLVLTLFNKYDGNDDRWRILAFIEPHKFEVHGRDFVAGWRVGIRLPGVDTWNNSRPNANYLRHSHGPRQGHWWDIYGDDYQTPELALLALLSAPVPPSLVSSEGWKLMIETAAEAEAVAAAGEKMG